LRSENLVEIARAHLFDGLHPLPVRPNATLRIRHPR
jgi:hypothetical protein